MMSFYSRGQLQAGAPASGSVAGWCPGVLEATGGESIHSHTWSFVSFLDRYVRSNDRQKQSLGPFLLLHF